MTESALLSLPLALAMCLSACGDSSADAGDGETAGSETATDTSTGDGDGDPSTGDGDGDPAGDGDADTSCPVGSEGCPCTGGGACDPGLMCDGGECVPASGDGDGDTGDGDGDGDGDTGDGDGDGDTGGSACNGDEFIAIEAIDADEIVGWNETMSQLGEGLILAYDNQSPNAYVQFNLDIPCDDDWHIWVRGINNQGADSYFALVDGEPMPVPIFELDCTNGPQAPEYQWGELNWRDQMAPNCEYVEDPWVQTWEAGAHVFTLGYHPQEAYALSRIWLTNTDQTPP
ncbi:hypothetical protein DB30_03485 [Enhygromyxa salina]|uniref:Endo-1,4-beta-xylanase A n=1 Tax=Enhygromyxa salina TaxID=215803 RepID=A0A0C2DC62_9BACT|nr:hypothetical protein [Enhygromyxa salina]KIG17302.1 hypothetical protein DB30_03485 [Enhygromyxa salina]